MAIIHCYILDLSARCRPHGRPAPFSFYTCIGSHIKSCSANLAISDNKASVETYYYLFTVVYYKIMCYWYELHAGSLNPGWLGTRMKRINILLMGLLWGNGNRGRGRQRSRGRPGIRTTSGKVCEVTGTATETLWRWSLNGGENGVTHSNRKINFDRLA